MINRRLFYSELNISKHVLIISFTSRMGFLRWRSLLLAESECRPMRAEGAGHSVLVESAPSCGRMSAPLFGSSTFVVLFFFVWNPKVDRVGF